MRKIILIVFLLATSQLKAIELIVESDLVRPPEDRALSAVHQIKANTNFRLNDEQAYRIYNAAKVASAFYSIPINIVLAIAYVESSYRLNAVNKASNDYGIMQVNEYHVKRSKLNKQKLLTNLHYSFHHGVRIFHWFYRTYPLDEAISRYNCGVRKRCIKYQKVKKYLTKVKKSM